MADDFDPEAFIKGEPQLPTVKATKQTFYYPATPQATAAAGLSYKMEGGTRGGPGFEDVHLPDHTIEKYDQGKSKFVATALAGTPTGAEFKMKDPDGVTRVHKNVDTGGGLVLGQADIATSDPQKAKTGEPGGFDPEAFVKGKPQLGTTIETHAAGGPDTGGFDPTAFIEGRPTPEETPSAKEEEARRGGGGGGVTPTPTPEIKLGVGVEPTFPGPTIPAATPMPTMIGDQIPKSPGEIFSTKSGAPTGPSYQQPGVPLPEDNPALSQFMTTPLISPQIARPIVQAVAVQAAVMNPAMGIEMEALRRLYPELAQGVTDSAAEQVSGATAPSTVPMLSAMAVPGVAEAWGANEFRQTPQHWRNIRQVIDHYGLGSRESAKALSDETARITMATGAVGVRAVHGAIAKMREKPVQQPQYDPESGYVDQSGNVVDTGTGTRESPPQLFKRKEIARAMERGERSVFTVADYEAQQKVVDLRQDYGWRVGRNTGGRQKVNDRVRRDLEAATFIEEAQGNPVALKHDADLIHSSKNKKLARKFGPIIDYAIKNFDRLYQTPSRYKKLMQDQLVEDAQAGITYGEQSDYVTHVLKNEPAGSLLSFLSQGGGGGLSRYFTKHREFNTLAEAINAGVEPASVNLADLAQHRIAASRRLILQKAMFNELRNMHGLDGRPAVAAEQGKPAAAGAQTVISAESPVWESAPAAAAKLPPPAEGTVRFYHGGAKEAGQAGRDFTMGLDYATGYAAKSGESGQVWYVDVPKDSPLLKWDDSVNRPVFNQIFPDELAGKAKPLPAAAPKPAAAGAQPPSLRGYERVLANGVDVNVHPDYAGLVKALYGDSALRRGPVGRGVLKTAGVMKAYTLAADTFHGFKGIMKGGAYGGKGSRAGYNRGTTVYELSDTALDKAVSDGDLSLGQAAWAKKARPDIETMMKNGLNVSRFADNIVGNMHVAFPGTRGLNNWIFNRVFRGAMLQASHANFLRNIDRFPELTREQVAQKTAQQMNEVFGNLGNGGVFKDKTVRDAMNVILLAPQWIESQARAEFRGYGELAQVIPDAAKGKFRMGVVAQGQVTSVAAMLIGNQIINFATTRHSTFQNPEGHRLAAYIPIGRGIYLDPFALSAEYVSRFMDVMERQGDNASIESVVTEMARGKLSNFGRAAYTVTMQRQVYPNKALEGSGNIALAAASELVPLPIPTTSAIQRDPSSPVGFTAQVPEWDRIAQQLLQSLGLRAKVDYPMIPMRLVPPSRAAGRGTARGGSARGNARSGSAR